MSTTTTQIQTQTSTPISTTPSPPTRPHRSLRYNLYTLWLFTYGDLKTIVGPKTLFALLNGAAAPLYKIQTSKPGLTWQSTLLSTLWLWTNLLPLVIDNQRRPSSIREDMANKPWRPLPSSRVSPSEARKLVLTLYPLALALSYFYLGGYRQAAALVVLDYIYNGLGYSRGVVSKNFINGLAFVSFASGAMEVALRTPLPVNGLLVSWFAIIFAVVFTTVQTQDMPDQEGDAAAGRQTIPIALGDWNARILTAGAMCFWSVFCPGFWDAPGSLYVVFCGLGGEIAWRCVFWRSVEDDKGTFVLWNAWMVVLYGMPLWAMWVRDGEGGL